MFFCPGKFFCGGCLGNVCFRKLKLVYGNQCVDRCFFYLKVLGLLDGTDATPVKTLEVEDANKKKTIIPNPAYTTWLSQDQMVLGFLVNSLSPEMIPHVVGIDTAAEVWSILTGMFSSHSRTKINHLRGSLNNTKKLDMSATQFFAKMKSFGSELAAACKPVEEDEMVGYILNGLDASYNDLVSSVNANPGTTLDDLYSQLCAHEVRQDMLAESGQGSSFTSSDNLAARPTRGGNRDFCPRGDRGRSPAHGGYHGDRGGGERRDDGGHRRDDGACDGGRRDGRRDDDGGRRDGRRDDARDGRRDDGGRRRDDGDRRRNDGGCRRGRAPTPFVDVTCQICNIHGHPANECWWRYQDRNDSEDDGEEKGAHVASYGVDTNCTLIQVPPTMSLQS
uniref:Uncharacterized protein n=1 Tax=Avena sativa TaxID=4498 RepID=A0ACD5XD94_AVESA